MSFTYRGLKAELKMQQIPEAEVERQLQRLLQQNPRVTQITDRPAQLGDEVILDYAGYCDGVQFEGGTAQNQSLVLGSGMFIPGFEEQLVGKAIEEPALVQVTFPEVYHSEALAGKAAEFHCTIHEIRVKTPYELDDTFAKEVGGCEDLAQMRQQLKKNMQAYTDERVEMDLQDRLLRQAADTLDYTVDPAELEAAVSEQMKSLEAQLAQQGLNLELYCSFMNTTVEDLHKDAYPAAEAAMRNHVAVEKIVELEKLEATTEEITQTLMVIAQQNKLTMEQLKDFYDADFEAAVMKSVLTSKVMRLIRDAADITVVE